MSVATDSISLCRSCRGPRPVPCAVLAEALAVVREAAEVLWSARSDDELVEVVARVQQLTSALAAVEAGAVAEADARDLAKQRLHYGSTGDWLTHVGGLSRGEGKRRVVRARALTGPLAGPEQGLVDGTVSPEQADVIVRAVDDLPSGDLVRRRGEKVLLRQAGHLDATELARAGRHLVEVVDPDAVDRRLEAALERQERAAHLTRYLSISPDRAGGVRLRGRGSAEDGALLMAALLPLTCPDPPDPAGPGDRGGTPRPPRPRRPALGRPGRHRPPRARHRPAAGDPRHPRPTAGHPRPADPQGRPGAQPGSAPPPTAPNSHPKSCAGSPVTPRSSPPSSAPTARSSTSAASAASSPPPSGPP